MTASDAAYDRYRIERAFYERAAAHVRDRLGDLCLQRGIPHRLEHRAKDLHSLVKKIVFKGYSYDGACDGSQEKVICDKAGVRVVPLYETDVNAIKEIVRKAFKVIHEKDHRAGLIARQGFGYRAYHLRVQLDEFDPGLKKAVCEIQIQTAGETIWSNVSHDLAYKAEEGTVPDDVARAVARFAALLEVVDVEAVHVRDMLQELRTMPDEMLAVAERHYYSLRPRPYDKSLSREIIERFGWLMGTRDPQAFARDVDNFVEKNRGLLEDIFKRYGDADDMRNPLLLQPEGVLILYALERDEFEVNSNWPVDLPLTILDSFKGIWGTRT